MAVLLLTCFAQSLPSEQLHRPRARTTIVTPIVVTALEVPHGIIRSILVHVGQAGVVEAGIYKSAGRRPHVHAQEPAGNQLAGILADDVYTHQPIFGHGEDEL